MQEYAVFILFFICFMLQGSKPIMEEFLSTSFNY